MMFFKKKKSIGQGRNEVIFLHKDMEALNYTPIDYMYNTKYSNFLKNREKVFEKLIDSTCPDDLCENMLDCYIDAITEEMKACSKEQAFFVASVKRLTARGDVGLIELKNGRFLTQVREFQAMVLNV